MDKLFIGCVAFDLAIRYSILALSGKTDFRSQTSSIKLEFVPFRLALFCLTAFLFVTLFPGGGVIGRSKCSMPSHDTQVARQT